MAFFLKGSWLAFAALVRAHLHRERGTPRPTPNLEAQLGPVQPPEPALPMVPPQPPPPPPPLLTPTLVLPLHPPPTEPIIPPALQSRRHPQNAPPLCPGCKALFLCTCCPSPPSSLTDTHSSPPAIQTPVSVSWGPRPPPLLERAPWGPAHGSGPREFDHPLREKGVAKQGYLAPNDHGGAGGQVAFSYCRSLYALALMFPPKLSSHRKLYQ
jgi:hypothetical protein